MKVGSLVFATDQGLGILAKSFFDAGVVTDVMVVKHGRRSEREDWYPNSFRVTNLNDPAQLQRMADFCKSVDVMLFFETPFVWPLLDKCRSYRVPTVLMPMYECMPKMLPSHPDMFLCPSLLDYSYYPGDKFHHQEKDGREVYTKSVHIPVPVEQHWYQRDRAEVFAHNSGHGGLKGRNGTREFLEAIPLVKSDARFVLRTQDRYHLDERLIAGAGDRLAVYGAVARDQLYLEDVFVFPEKFNGLSLPLQEARAAGMLVMATDRFPMNMWLPISVPTGDEILNPLISISGSCTSNVSPRCNDFEEAIIDPRDIAAKIDEWYGRDISVYSLQGREWAKENSWEVLKPKYLSVLEELCKGT